jgi:hypothetical protein
MSLRAMTKTKIALSRSPPKRTITKKQAARHLIHSACRLISAREDPFAIHLLIQSADKLLIDISKRTGQKLAFSWGELIKPEYKDTVIAAIRETSNFLKHADKDHDARLHVANIAETNILQIGICIVNYNHLFGEWTDHMKLFFNVAKIFSPASFVADDRRPQFDIALLKIKDLTFAEYLNGWWDDPLFKRVLPHLASEKIEDLQDTTPLYEIRIGDLQSARK